MGLSDYRIAELTLGKGHLGIAPLPGRHGALASDLNAVLRWGAGMVLTMNTAEELERSETVSLGAELATAGVDWRHLPIPDFGAPPPETAALWPDVSRDAHRLLEQGGKVFAHCYGGCGRSGMALMRLMVEAGEDADPALDRLRAVRACAVETEDQRSWAALPMVQRKGLTK